MKLPIALLKCWRTSGGFWGLPRGDRARSDQDSRRIFAWNFVGSRGKAPEETCQGRDHCSGCSARKFSENQACTVGLVSPGGDGEPDAEREALRAGGA